jgi:hypothetical protein
MALVIANRVQETTTTTGTGTVTLAGAVAGFQSFAVVGNTNTTYYTITSGTAWEVGIGTYSTTGPTLTRTTILSSSNANAAITLAGTSSVFSSYPAEKVISDGYGLLPVANGGTGATTLTANGVLYGSGTSAIAATAVGTTGEVLVGNTGGAPSWAALTGIGVTSFSAGTTGLTPSSATTGVVTLAGTLGVANGGTGATTLTSGYLVKGNGTSAVSASVVYDDGTNVGIGTTSPLNKLQINGANIGIRISDTSGTTDFHEIQSGGVNGQNLFIDADRNNVGSGNMIFRVAGATERMRITSAGNVGIGTSSPAQKLDVTGSANSVQARFGNVAGRGLTIGTTAISGTNDAGVVFNAPSVSGHATLIFQTNSAERMRIDASGNVGIGTSSPSSFGGTLDFVVGTGSGSPAMTLYGGNATFSSLNFADGTVGNETYRGFLEYNHATDALNIGTAGSERMRITSAGFVGIGTSSPTRPLTVSKAGEQVVGEFINPTASETARIYATCGTATGIFQQYGQSHATYPNMLAINAASGQLSLWSSSVEIMRIGVGGNVGIGITSPAYKLEVAGDVRIAGGGGDLRIQSATGTTTAGGDSLIYNDVNNMIFTTGTTTAERMRIDASGNASIGTTTGLARLRVAAASAVNAPVLGNVTNYPAFFSNSDVGYGLGIGTSAGDGHVWLQAQRSDSATAYNLTLNEAGGNVGIGITSPGQKLSVAGTVESTTGGFKFPDGTTQTTAVSANVMELISTASPSTASEVVFTGLTSAYTYYEIVFETSAGYVSRCQLSTDNGSTFLTSYYYSNDTIFGTSTVTQTGTSGIGQTYIDLGAASYAGIIQFLYPTSDESVGSSIQSQTQGLTTSSYRASGRHLSGGNNAIRLYPQTGTVTGTFKLYGVKA